MIGNPLGLIALLALPAIVGIHLFRRRFRRRPVAGLFLWTSPGQDPSAGRRIHRLENNASLWLELLLAACSAIYLLDLKFGQSTPLPHEIFVLDDSRSLQAVAGDGTSAADRARERNEEILDAAGPRAQASIVLAGPRPIMLAGPAAPAAAAREALRTWRPEAPQADFEPALALARELAGDEAIVRVISDLPPGAVRGATDDPRLDWSARGRPLANAALIALGRERGDRDADPDRVFVQIAAFGGEPRPVRLRIHRGGPDGPLVHESSPLVDPARSRRLALDIAADDDDLHVILEDDALAADNRGLLVRPARRRVGVYLGFAEEDARRAYVAKAVAAITTAEALPLRTPTASEAMAPVQVLIADAGFDPADLDLDDAASRLLLGPPDRPAESESGGDSAVAPPLLGPFLSEVGHGLLDGVSFDRVLWRGAGPGGEPAWTPLVSSGDWMLLGADPTRADRSFILNIALGRGSLVRSPDWPVLVANLVAERRRRLPGSDRTQLRLGESLRLVLPPGDRAGWVLHAPDGTTRALAELNAVDLAGLDQIGLWEVRRQDEMLHRFAVNALDPEESNLQAAATERRDASAGEVTEDEGASLVDPRLHFPLVLAGLAAFFLNWWVLRRARRLGAGS